ncbi:MAG: methyltransferase domain-containing protein [Gemmataceae bacterium]
MSYWKQCLEFYTQFRHQYFTTGSIWPSSRGLARALTRPMRRAAPPRRILEVGPGTGAVTQEIVRWLRPGDELDIVEINGAFVEIIERRFREEAEFRTKRRQSRVLHSPLQEVPGRGVYDFMISGLPLNNFPVPLVDEIFQSYERLLKPLGTLSYFEYLWMRATKMAFIRGAEKERLTRIDAYLKDKIARYQVAEEVVVLNVPSAVARHFCFGRKTVG